MIGAAALVGTVALVASSGSASAAPKAKDDKAKEKAKEKHEKDKEKAEKADEKRAADKAKEKAKSKAKEKDWQAAVAEALASHDAGTVKRVASELKKAGLAKQAESLLDAFAELSARLKADKAKKDAAKKKSDEAKKASDKAKRDAEAKAASAAREKDAAKKKEKEQAARDAARRAEEAARKAAAEKAAADKLAAEQKARKTDPKPEPKPSAPKPSAPKADKHRQLAEKAAGHLASATRRKEDTSLVKQYQADNALTADGLYGPGTAKSLWVIYEILPPNPLYWSKTQSTANKQVGDYRKFLDDIVRAHPSYAGRVEKLKATLGQ
jgi:hypothetical protein